MEPGDVYGVYDGNGDYTNDEVYIGFKFTYATGYIELAAATNRLTAQRMSRADAGSCPTDTAPAR